MVRTRASVVNVEDGSLRYEVAFDVVVSGSSQPSLSNSATAVSSCTACRTVVISVQLALLNGDVLGVATDNQALAVQIDCELCESLAAAYQFVIVSPDAGGFSRDALAQLRRIERQLRQVARSSLPLDELAAEVDALAARALTVMATDLGLALPGGQVDGAEVPVRELDPDRSSS